MNNKKEIRRETKGETLKTFILAMTVVYMITSKQFLSSFWGNVGFVVFLLAFGERLLLGLLHIPMLMFTKKIERYGSKK